MNSFVWTRKPQILTLHIHVKLVNEKPYHPPESTGYIFPVHPPLRTINGTARLRHMYKQKSYVYFKQDWLAAGGCWGGVNWCVRPQQWRSFIFTLFCSCSKSKACNERKDVNIDILLLANWKTILKGKCRGRHLVCNYWWYIHSLLWFMQPTGRCDRVKLHDILTLIDTGNADSPGRVYVCVCGGGGGGGRRWE